MVSSGNETSPQLYLARVLKTVTTGQTTVSVSGGMGGMESNSVWGHYNAAAGNETFLNVTGPLTTGDSKEGNDYLWLTLRLFFIACFITGLIVLTWASYTIHKKCFDERPKRKYQKALLL
ncbi:hypothetical protein EGW08_016346 [Elysia chlorotica]|uniref:Uncharacterized protein n=1 Tax=Elysia chlorotica TaxID=188477 RepID=A0A433T2V3_ELYCH|nr:hypothetical protein EGW08_016346 [Elysia chlorotica]